MSHFESVALAPADPILGLTLAFQKDTRKDKANLGVGLYNTEELVTPVLYSVKQAEALLLEKEKSKEYLPIEGDRLYLDRMGALVFGESAWGREKGRIATFQTVGGTGALKIGATFLKEEAEHPLWIPSPTWPNHLGVFSHAGLQLEKYPYCDLKSHTLDFDALVSCLERLKPASIVLLHASCHNPTGIDPSLQEWKLLCQLFKRQRLIPFFDFAYQGFGMGLEQDAEAVRLFLESGQEMLIAVSNAKNFSLYAERAGCLMIVSESEKIASSIASRVKQMIRTNYSNPPMHGAKIVSTILNTPPLKSKWEKELEAMRERICVMRQLLASKSASFSHMKNGRGMFGFTGLNRSQVERMLSEHAIYMPADGRINVCGLNHENIDAVVRAILEVALA